MVRRSALADLETYNPNAAFDALVLHDFAPGSTGCNAHQVAAALGALQHLVWASIARLIARGHLAHPMLRYFISQPEGMGGCERDRPPHSCAGNDRQSSSQARDGKMFARTLAVANIHAARHGAVAGHRQRLVVALSPIHRLLVARCRTRFMIQRRMPKGNLVHAARSISRTGITWLAREHAGTLPADVEAALTALKGLGDLAMTSRAQWRPAMPRRTHPCQPAHPVASGLRWRRETPPPTAGPPERPSTALIEQR